MKKVLFLFIAIYSSSLFAMMSDRAKNDAKQYFVFAALSRSQQNETDDSRVKFNGPTLNSAKEKLKLYVEENGYKSYRIVSEGEER